MKPLTPEQLPYTGPYGLATSGLPSKGPTVEALKRAMGRLGLLPWRDYDRHYNAVLEAALDNFDPGNNGYGNGRWTKLRAAVIPAGLWHEGERALDAYAIKLIQDEAGSTGTTDEQRAQHYITEFWELAITNRGNWHYSQDRLFVVTVDPSGTYIKADCSATPVMARRYAALKTGLKLADPSRQNFSGAGNTDLFEDDWPKIGSPFRVGDLAHFHSERHVIECIHAGTIDTAVWGSNGGEAAPEKFTLSQYHRFPGEFLFVVRPDILAA